MSAPYRVHRAKRVARKLSSNDKTYPALGAVPRAVVAVLALLLRVRCTIAAAAVAANTHVVGLVGHSPPQAPAARHRFPWGEAAGGAEQRLH